MIKLRHTFFAGLPLILGGCKWAILDPKGIIAASEKQLLIDATLLMLIVVIPVIILSFVFAWRYRKQNAKAQYKPEWSHSYTLEAIWWAIPCIIILILASMTWVSTHKLDPYHPLDSKTKPLIIQAVALDWKWLFIYPEQKIATVNFVQMPVDVPVRFLITADAPMNSFAIPQLAGQIYAMTGMQTKLNLMANKVGDYDGMSTNFSGDGFSGMRFIARVSSQQEFDQWVKTAQRSRDHLTVATYNQLKLPSENNPVAYFSSPAEDLFNRIIMQYMMPDMPLSDNQKKMDHKEKPMEGMTMEMSNQDMAMSKAKN